MDGKRWALSDRSLADSWRPDYRKLKPGPGQAPDEVACDQRRRLHEAMIELVSERGYEAVTVRELTGRAGVSQATLYRHFASKEECFLETYELIVRFAVQAALVAHRRASSWRERISSGIGALVAEMAAHPRAAHLALVDCYSAWPLSLGRMTRTDGLFDALLADSVARAPDGGVTPPPRLAKAITAGIAWVVREHLLTGREREIADLSDDLVAWALSLLSEEAGELGRIYEPEPPLLGARLAADWSSPPDERSLLLEATARLAAEEGFEGLTVPRIRAVAGVSRRSFDTQFENVTECFLAAIEHQSGQALSQVAAAAAAVEAWPEAVCRVLTAFCDLVRDERLATITFVEIFAPGPEGVRCRSRLLAEIAADFRASAPAGQRPSPVAAEASLGAVWSLAYEEIAAGRARRMPEIAGTLAFVALAPSLGPRAAAAAIREQRGLGAEPVDDLLAAERTAQPVR